MKKKVLYMMFGLLAVCLTGVGCAGSADNTAHSRRVTVSIAPLEYFVNAIAGDSIEVVTLLGETVDPETYQPSAGVMMQLAQSDLLFTSGVLPFEEQLVGNIKLNNSSLRVESLSDGITYIYGTHSHSHVGEDREHHHDNVHEANCHAAENNEDNRPDPHIWSSVKNAKMIASNVGRKLMEVYPGLAGYFEARTDSLISHLAALDSLYASRLQPADAFAIWHPSLSYFARDYGLRQIAINLENKETTPMQLRAVTDNIARLEPMALFVPAGLNLFQVKAITEHMELLPVEINVMSADWEEEMNNIVDALTRKNSSSKP